MSLIYPRAVKLKPSHVSLAPTNLLSTNTSPVPPVQMGTKPSKAQHRALTTPDIIREILEKLIENTEEGIGHARHTKDLLSMARCCWDFRSPSLDLLWRRMDSFDPLLMLLPGALRIQKGRILFQWEYVHPTQLVRFTEYGRRILDLEIVVAADFVEIPMWRWLENRDHALLPCLRSLKVLYRDASLIGKERSLFVLPTLLRSPSLHSIAIDLPLGGDEDTDGLGPVCHLIAESESNAKSISLSGALFKKYIPYLATMQKVHSVSLKLSDTSAMLDALTALTSISILQQLSLDVSAFDTLPIKELKFPYLKELTLRGTLQIIGTILARTTVEKLEGITVHITADVGSAQPFRLDSQPPTMFQLVLSRFCAVRKVRVDWGGVIWDHDHAIKDATSFVKPLMRLRHVEELVLTSLESFIGFSDEDIINLANACGSQLKVLRFEHKAPPTGSRPSFLCLDHLAKACPRLIELSLTLAEGSLKYQMPDHASDHPLSTLHLQHTDIMHHARVARYIDGLFPHLVHFDSVAPVDGQLVATVIFDTCRPVRKDQEQRVRRRQNNFGQTGP